MGKSNKKNKLTTGDLFDSIILKELINTRNKYKNKLINAVDGSEISRLRRFISSFETPTIINLEQGSYINSTYSNIPVNFNLIHIDRFRQFNNLTIDNTSKINIFCGINNSGKTTILEAIKLLCDMNNPNGIRQLILGRAKICNNEVDFQWLMSQFISFNISASCNKQNISLSCMLPEAIEDFEAIPIIFDVVYKEKINKSISVFHSPARIVNSNRIQQLCHSVFLSPFSSLDPKLIRTYHDKSLSVGSKERIIQLLQETMDPNILDIELNSQNRFIVQHKTIKPNPDITSFGEGLQRIYMIGLLFAGAENGVVLIDELENAIHKSLLPKVVRLIHELAEQFHVQVFISTHSKECVDAFIQDEAIRDQLSGYTLDPRDGQIEVFQFSGKRLADLAKFINFDLR